MFSPQSQESNEKNDEGDCVFCAHNSSQLILWLRQNQYRKQNNFQTRYIRVTNHILNKSRTYAYINYKEAVINSTSPTCLNSLEYKDWEQIVNQIKSSILRNLQINKSIRYDKLYINSQIMLKNQIKKHLLATRKLYKKQQRINPSNIQKSNRIPSEYEQRILINSQLRTCYNFYQVDNVYEKNKSKKKISSNQNNINRSLSQSQMEMQKLRNQLQIMINEMKQLNELSSYENNIDFGKVFLDYNKLKDQMKFKTKLAVNYSDIIQIDSKNNKRNTKLKMQNQLTTNSKLSHIDIKNIINQNKKMYTSPDLGKDNNSQIENKYAEMYGCLLKRERKGKGISKGKEKKESKRLNQNDMKFKINNIGCKKTRQLGTSSTTISGNNITPRKSNSKSKLKVKPSISSTANTLTVHISSSRCPNITNMNSNHNNTKRLTQVKSVSRSKLEKNNSVSKLSTTKRGAQKQKQ